MKLNCPPACLVSSCEAENAQTMKEVLREIPAGMLFKTFLRKPTVAAPEFYIHCCCEAKTHAVVDELPEVGKLVGKAGEVGI